MKKGLKDLTDRDFINAQEFLYDFCEHHKITVDLLRGRRRGEGLPKLRQKAALQLVDRYSLAAIGVFLNRDHTTILHYTRRG